jgi:hypothetical protein
VAFSRLNGAIIGSMASNRPVAGTHEVRGCFHATAMVLDYGRTLDVLARLVGCRALEDHRSEDPAIGRRGGMTWIGDNSLELGEPTVADGAVDRFVRRFGSHMSSIAVQVGDTDSTVAFLERHGVPVVSRVDHDIVFTDPRATGGISIEWYGGQAENDPRCGAPIPRARVRALLDVRRVAFAGAVVDAPEEVADLLAALFHTEVTFIEPDAPPGRPRAGVSLRDMTLALYARAEVEESRRLWGHVYHRAQTSNLGVQVPDLDEASTALAEHSIPVVRQDDGCAVIHPDATGGIVLVVTDHLLPGDPRLALPVSDIAPPHGARPPSHT